MKRALLLILTLCILLPLLPAAGAEAAAPITFTESENFPLPNAKTQLRKGQPFTIDGTVRSVSPLVKVTATIKSSKGKVLRTAEKTFSPSEQVTEYRLLDPTFSARIDCLSERIRFDKLSAGSYRLELSAEDEAGNRVTLAAAAFAVTAAKWVRLLPNNLRNNYTDALRFFGSTEKFLFRYRFAKGRSIQVDSAWRKKYARSAVGVNGKKWSCHKDAVPYFEQAARYIRYTFVRVRGDGFDTGAVRLSDLVTYNGSMVLRFVSSRDFVSHHAFGTAIDINAKLPSNRNVLSNRETIYREVSENLTYNGLETTDGKVCYDFTYTGHADKGPKNVPEPIVNYLVYELGFFRAGFSWGLYYPHTCDGMHFSLSELSPSLFEDGPYAMRKVFSYLEPLYAKPEVRTEPRDATVKSGKKATFKVVAQGEELKYQWYCRTSESAAWKPVASKGTSASYSVKAKKSMEGYQYRCLIRNAAGEVYTAPVTLHIKRK